MQAPTGWGSRSDSVARSGVVAHAVLVGSTAADPRVRCGQKVAETCPARRALEAGFTFDEQVVVGDQAASVA